MRLRRRPWSVLAAAGALLLVAAGRGSGGADDSPAAPGDAEPVAAAACQDLRPADGVPVTAGGTKHTIRSGHVEREYAVWFPAGTDPTVPAPVVVDLHGAGGEAVGFSTGAGMSAQLSCELDGIAAVAPVTGVNLHRPCAAPKVPVLSVHGDVDEYVAFGGVPVLSDLDGTGPFVGDVTAVMDRWAERNGCRAGRVETDGADGSVVRTYADCPAGQEAVLHVLAGAKHFYPGGGANREEPGYSAVPVPELVLDFFDAH